jgi:phosphodiesterase/alkaline phosphatase D-like protein
MRRLNLAVPLRCTALAAAALFLGQPAFALPSFTAVAAGDMTSDSAIVWTRALDGAGSATGLTLQIATDAGFSAIARTVTGLSSSDASSDYTLKLDVTGLDSGQKYYYRFSGAGVTSDVGTFKTAYAASYSGPVKMAFSGDADGLMRPFTLVNNFSAAAPRDFFVFLGDTIYETASAGSAAAASPTTGANPGNLSTVLNDYHRKYLENLQGVTATGVPTTAAGQQGLKAMYAAQGNYTLLDNHELGNKQYINGGAPIAALDLSGNGANFNQLGGSVHNTGAAVNSTAGYQTFLKAYTDYEPIRVTTGADNLQKLYFAQNWGTNLSFTNVDDRSYRDVRLKTLAGADDTPAGRSGSGRWADPSRTMLGATQLSWLEGTLQQQQTSGQKWKIVALSSPIDQAGNDGGKSWYGGYQAERNTLFKFIDDNHIDNVVFLSTDDHFSRVTELWYDTPTGKKRLDSAFSIVTGPIGATGPDIYANNHSFANIGTVSAAVNANLAAENMSLNGGQAGNQFGLQDFGGRVTNVKRDQNGVLVAGSANDAINYFSPDTFAYTNLDVDADGTLHVTVLGIDSYATNTFPTTGADPRVIFSFDVTPVPEPAHWAMLLAGLGLVGLARKAGSRAR